MPAMSAMSARLSGFVLALTAGAALCVMLLPAGDVRAGFEKHRQTGAMYGPGRKAPNNADDYSRFEAEEELERRRRFAEMTGERLPPPPIDELLDADSGLETQFDGLEIRRDAVREAALSYGARGGLAWRTWQIRETLKQHEDALDRTYDFKRLMIAAPSGLILEPPVIGELQDALKLDGNRQTAAVADRVYRIGDEAKLATAPRNWRTYLERDWGEVIPPPAMLLPQSADERKRWRRWVREGWDAGVEQAELIYQQDLDRLNRDFTGMVRYRKLASQGMVSEPFALQEDRGITGGGRQMRVGDRAVKITGPSTLDPRGERWIPATR